MVDIPGFAVQVTGNGHGAVVRLAGDLDLAAAGEFRECLHPLLGESVTLDFTDVTFMDSTAISVLVTAQKGAAVAGGELVLHGVQPAQMRVFEICGLMETFDFDGASDVPQELVDATHQELEYPADETDEG